MTSLVRGPWQGGKGPRVAASFVGASDSPAGSRPEAPGQPHRYPAVFFPTLMADEMEQFKRFAPHAFWVGGNLDGPQPMRIGDNAGRWQVRTGVTGQWKPDKRDKGLVDGAFARNFVSCWWCDWDKGSKRSYASASALEGAVCEALRAHYEPGLDGMLLFDPETRLGHVEHATHKEAERLGIEIWTTRELATHLRRLVGIAQAMGAAEKKTGG